MAEIAQWITVNGVHIPIMKGESKIRAVGKFIKSKRSKKLDEEYYKQRKAGKDWKEANEAIRQKIKGYSTDPDNKVKKAEKAYKEAYDQYDKYRQQAQDDYNANWFNPSSKLRAERYAEEDAIWDKYPSSSGKINAAKRKAELRRLYNNRDQAKQQAEEFVRNTERIRDDTALSRYTRELNAKSKSYKLKTDEIKGEKKRKITGYKNNSNVDWSSGKPKEIEVTYWRSNPQLTNGGYEMKRTYTARTEGGLMRQVRKSENATVYGGLSFKSYKEKPRTYKKIDSTKAQREAYSKYKQEHPTSKMKFQFFKEKYYKNT